MPASIVSVTPWRLKHLLLDLATVVLSSSAWRNDSHSTLCQVWGYTPQTPIIANTLDHTKPMLIMIQKVSKSNATACMQCNICEWSKWTLFFPKKLMEKRNIVFMNFLHLFSRHFIRIKWQIVGWVRCSWNEACI